MNRSIVAYEPQTLRMDHRDVVPRVASARIAVYSPQFVLLRPFRVTEIKSRLYMTRLGVQGYYQHRWQLFYACYTRCSCNPRRSTKRTFIVHRADCLGLVQLFVIQVVLLRLLVCYDSLVSTGECVYAALVYPAY